MGKENSDILYWATFIDSIKNDKEMLEEMDRALEIDIKNCKGSEEMDRLMVRQFQIRKLIERIGK